MTTISITQYYMHAPWCVVLKVYSQTVQSRIFPTAYLLELYICGESANMLGFRWTTSLGAVY